MGCRKSNDKLQYFNLISYLVAEPDVKIYGCALPPGSEDSEVLFVHCVVNMGVVR